MLRNLCKNVLCGFYGKKNLSIGFINPEKRIIWETQIKHFCLGFKRNISKRFKNPDKKNYLENPDKIFLSDPDKRFLSGFIYS